MAGASLLSLLDDIATMLDDIALMSKVAARKTAGVLGDDLALNAQQVSGIKADRELPVVWAVAKGSLRNKIILVPAALLVSGFIPWAITPLLMLGGLFLCYEGFEKVYHSLTADKKNEIHHIELELKKQGGDLQVFERNKIAGAIRTDFVLSAEIIAITLGVVAESSFTTQVSTLCIIAVLITFGVYGLVAGIVKLDDAGLYLSRRQGDEMLPRLARWFGHKLVNAAPYLMRGLTIVGTIAMFMVGGGILTHGLHLIGEQFAYWTSLIAQWQLFPSYLSGILSTLMPSILNALFGVLAGAIALLLVSMISKLKA